MRWRCSRRSRPSSRSARTAASLSRSRRSSAGRMHLRLGGSQDRRPGHLRALTPAAVLPDPALPGGGVPEPRGTGASVGSAGMVDLTPCRRHPPPDPGRDRRPHLRVAAELSARRRRTSSRSSAVDLHRGPASDRSSSSSPSPSLQLFGRPLHSAPLPSARRARCRYSLVLGLRAPRPRHVTLRVGGAASPADPSPVSSSVTRLPLPGRPTPEKIRRWVCRSPSSPVRRLRQA